MEYGPVTGCAFFILVYLYRFYYYYATLKFIVVVGRDAPAEVGSDMRPYAHLNSKTGCKFISILSMEKEDFITSFEAEHMVGTIKRIGVEEYGSKAWVDQHYTLDRLNLQAHKNALHSTDEYVMNSFAVQNKVKDVIYDLVVTETWKQRLFPLLKSHLLTLSSVKTYVLLYHEAVVCNLLEIMLFHKVACEAAEDSLLELVDYSYRKLLKLSNWYGPRNNPWTGRNRRAGTRRCPARSSLS